MGTRLYCALYLAFIINSYVCTDSVRLARMIRSSHANLTRSATFEDVRAAGFDSDVYLIDVREPLEIEDTGAMPGSINIPLSEIKGVLEKMTPEDFRSKYGREKPDFNSPIIFTCRTGRRSLIALHMIEELGYLNLSNFDGGWLYWEKKLAEDTN